MATAFSVNNSNKPDFAATSEKLSLTIPAPLTAPELSSPDDLENYTYQREITLTWVAVSGATEYELQLCDNSSFLTFQTKSWRTASVSQLTYHLEEEKNYYWRVRAIASKVSSEWSDVRQLSTRKDKDTAQDVRRPVIDNVSADSENVDPSTDDDEKSTQVSVEYNTSKGDTATGYKWRCWTYVNTDGSHSSNPRDVSSMLSSKSANGCTFVSPIFTGDLKEATFYVRLKAWNKAGGNNAACQVTAKITSAGTFLKYEVAP